MEAGVNAQFAPLGSPMQDSETAPAVPATSLIVTMVLAVLPAVTVAGVSAAADSPKLGGLVFSTTAIPVTPLTAKVHGKTRSVFPSPFISVSSSVLGSAPLAGTLINCPNVPSPLPSSTPV
jgi:hypothetical protein